jgi:hypothetical protein
MIRPRLSRETRVNAPFTYLTKNNSVSNSSRFPFVSVIVQQRLRYLCQFRANEVGPAASFICTYARLFCATGLEILGDGSNRRAPWLTVCAYILIASVSPRPSSDAANCREADSLAGADATWVIALGWMVTHQLSLHPFYKARLMRAYRSLQYAPAGQGNSVAAVDDDVL